MRLNNQQLFNRLNSLSPNGNPFSVRGMDFSNMVFVKANPNDFDATQLPQTIAAAYILHDNKLYYKDKLSSEVIGLSVVSTEQQKILDDFSEYKLDSDEDQSHAILLPSQTAAMSKISHHVRERDYFTFTKINDAWQCQFANQTVTITEDDNPLPITLSNLLYMLDRTESQEVIYDSEGIEKISLSDTPQWLQWALWFIELPVSVLQTVLRYAFLDNPLIKYTVGNLVAVIANHGNSHYVTEPEPLSTLLAGLIFPGGAKKGRQQENGNIVFDPTLSRQLHSLIHAGSHWDENQKTFNYNGIIFAPREISMPDKKIICGVSARNGLAMQQENINDILYVIKFNGNSGSYQEEMPQDAHFLAQCETADLPVDLIRFNYPGVIDSTGRPETPKYLIESGIAQVQHLLNHGIRPENIQLHGNSLGGCISTCVAEHFYSKGIKLGGLCVSRTFSSTTNVATSYISRVPYVGRLLALILRPFVVFGLWASDWYLDTAKNFSILPEDKVWYTQARSPKAVHGLFKNAVLDDNVLAYDCSLHNSWRMRLKRFLVKNFGLFGCEQGEYKTMNSAHKLVVSQEGQHTHHLCAHVDAHCFGGSIDSNTGDAVPSSEKSPRLMTRQPLPKLQADTSTNVAFSHELGEQTLQFCKAHRPHASQSESDLTNNLFHSFFKPQEQRSNLEKAASYTVNGILRVIP